MRATEEVSGCDGRKIVRMKKEIKKRQEDRKRAGWRPWQSNARQENRRTRIEMEKGEEVCAYVCVWERETERNYTQIESSLRICGRARKQHPVGRNPGRSIVVLYLPPNIFSGPGGVSKVTPTPPREHDVDLSVSDSRPVPHSYRISCACALDDEEPAKLWSEQRPHQNFAINSHLNEFESESSVSLFAGPGPNENSFRF